MSPARPPEWEHPHESNCLPTAAAVMAAEVPSLDVALGHTTAATSCRPTRLRLDSGATHMETSSVRVASSGATKALTRPIVSLRLRATNVAASGLSRRPRQNDCGLSLSSSHREAKWEGTAA